MIGAALEVRPGQTKFYVDGNLELSVPTTGALRPGLYAFSQRVVFDDFTVSTEYAGSSLYGAPWPAQGFPGIAVTNSMGGPAGVPGSSGDIVIDNNTASMQAGCIVTSTAMGSMVMPSGLTVNVGAPIVWARDFMLLPGSTLIPYAIANDANLCGSSFFLQVYHTDSNAPGGFAASRGLRVDLGAP